MRTSRENRIEEPATDSIVLGRRVFAALLVALGLCGSAFVVCWLLMLSRYTPQDALARTVNHMVWICPVLTIFGLPLALLYFEKKGRGKSLL
jgi:hypothetical protein